MESKIVHGDSYEILSQIVDNSFGAVIIDPPYGMGLDEWDKPVDVAFFTEQFKRIGREFYAVFGQMPYIREWDRQAERQGLHFVEHISWVKRTTNPSIRLSRTHETILIYALGRRKQFYKVTGKFEDVKVPGIMVDLLSIEGVKRYISDLHLQLKCGKPRETKENRTSHKAYSRFQYKTPMAREIVNFSNAWSFLPEAKKTLNKGGNVHCTMKPVLLMMRLVEMLTPDGGSVIDCFSGSGTTAIACERLNRQYLCIEREQKFYEHSIERLKSDAWQPELNFNMT